MFISLLNKGTYKKLAQREIHMYICFISQEF